MSLGLLFPGQGTQTAGMLAWLDTACAAQALLTQMADLIGTHWRAHCDDADWRSRNDIAQPLLTGVSLAAWQVLQPLLPSPTVIAGYSVGELAAFSAAGVLAPELALDLACQRAALMNACQKQGSPSGLLSVSGVPVEHLTTIAGQHHCEVAIRLAADRAILGGTREALARLDTTVQREGARTTWLAVQVASHTSALAPAVAPLARVLAAHPFERPRCPIVCNATSLSERRPAALRDALSTQIAHTVCWDSVMDSVVERGVRCVLEVGPGATLSKLWNERFPAVPARSADEFQTPDGVASWVHRMLAR